MEASNQLSILLLCDFDPFNAQMVQDSIHALARQSRHQVRCLSFRGDLPADLDLSRFDAVAVHYSTFIYSDHYLSPGARRRIAAFEGSKAVFLHDEYKHVNRTKAALAELGVGALFTCFEDGEARRVYADLVEGGLRIVSVLPGYVSPELARLDPGPPTAQRPIDIGYRGRAYPAWHGELGQDRVRIHEGVLARAAELQLAVDSSVAERDRLYGAKWLDFQRRCKTALGTESGASVIDFTGQTARSVEAHVAAAPDTPFEELRRLYFADIEGKFPLRTISPRIFEALACGCGLILYEGAYAGRLKPERHYLPLRRDHANFNDVAKLLREPGRIDAMIRTAREEVLLAPQNQEAHFVGVFDDAMERMTGRRAAAGYDEQDFTRRFGRYDSVLNRPVLTRQFLRLAHSAYTTATQGLPPPLERRLRGAVRGFVRRVTGH